MSKLGAAVGRKTAKKTQILAVQRILLNRYMSPLKKGKNLSKLNICNLTKPELKKARGVLLSQNRKEKFGLFFKYKIRTVSGGIHPFIGN